jgi:magnesium transporter
VPAAVSAGAGRRFALHGDESCGMALSTTRFHQGSCTEGSVPFAEISELLKDPLNLVWVDAVTPTPEEITALEEEFGLHPLAVEDALNAHQRPKVDRYDGFVFIVAYGATVENESVQQHEVGMFVAPNYVITVRHEPPLDVANLRDRLLRATADLRDSGGAFLAYVVLDEVVDGYFTVIAHLQDRLEDIEETLVWGDKHTPENLSAAYQVRRDVIYLRRVVAPLREVFNALVRRDEVLFDHHLDEYFRDLYDHVTRIYEELDTDRDLLAAALEDHLSVVSNQLNRVVLKVSAWAAIIALPTFIASLYGMNFHHMPELSWQFGYGYALLLMLATGSLLYALFKKSGWL